MRQHRGPSTPFPAIPTGQAGRRGRGLPPALRVVVSEAAPCPRGTEGLRSSRFTGPHWPTVSSAFCWCCCCCCCCCCRAPGSSDAWRAGPGARLALASSSSSAERRRRERTRVRDRVRESLRRRRWPDGASGSEAVRRRLPRLLRRPLLRSSSLRLPRASAGGADADRLRRRSPPGGGTARPCPCVAAADTMAAGPVLIAAEIRSVNTWTQQAHHRRPFHSSPQEVQV